MSFKSYAVETSADGLMILSDPQPLMFSGRHGLIAKFVLGEKDRASRPWKLCPGEIHALAFVETLVRDRVIMFEQSEDLERSLMWLQSISGISNSTTEMMFSFTPVIVAGQNPLRVKRGAVDRGYGEDLALDGGVYAPTSGWRWKKPHLALGGVVLGSRTRPGGGGK